MTRRQATDNTAQERVDAAIVDAYERRIAGLSATAEDDALQAEIAAAELQAYVSLHQRVAAIPQGEVSSGVRSVVLSAAVQAAEEHVALRQQNSPLARLLTWVMRPGPLMAIVTALAIVVAVSVRQEGPTSGAAPAKLDTAVAMADPPTIAPTAEVVAPAVAAAAPAAVAPSAAAEAVAAPPAAPAAAPAEAAPAAPVLARPMHTIAAQAASLGPVDSAADRADAPRAVANEQGAKREVAQDDYKMPQKAAAKVANDEASYGSHAAEVELDVQNKKAIGKAIADSLREETQNQNQRPGNAAPQQQAQGNAPAPEGRAPSQPQAAANKDVATRNQVAEKAGADEVARWQQSAQEAETPEDRIAALKHLVVAAQAAGDDKTVKVARQALKVAEAQVVARKRAESLQETPPSQRAKAAPSQGAAELKAQKPKN